MESKTTDIIEVGQGWACALRGVNDTLAVHCYYHNQLIAEVPVSEIVACIPFNHTPQKEEKKPWNAPFSTDKVPEPKSLIKTAITLNSLLCKATQSTNAYVVKADSDAPSLVIAVGGNSRYVYDDSELGNRVTTTEAAQNLAATGAAPVAFFKLSPPADATYQPTLGLVGLRSKDTPPTTRAFAHKGDMIYLLGRSVDDIASSEYLYSIHHIHPSPAPYINPQEQIRLQTVLAEAILKNLISGINSVTKGGIFTALVESSLPHQLGFDITTDAEIREDAFLFGESLGRFIVSTSEEHDAAFVDLMTRHKIPVTTLGHITKGEIRIDDISYGFIHDFA
ncbi:MAG: AIR synthase-related protein [Bacteroidetes bacterium]|nr:AIR synthase-related protein [Bacteroidota bacterium]